MTWNAAPLRSWIANSFSIFIAQKQKEVGSSLESIREAMLEAIGPLGAIEFPVVQLRVSHAHDVEDLWYLRGDLMATLSNIYGEALAKTKIAQISEMFRGLVPSGLSSRPSPLGD